MAFEEKITKLKAYVHDYPDFPKPGIIYRDLCTSLLNNPEAFRELRDLLVEFIKINLPEFDVIVGLESRGFIFGSFLAFEFGVGFVPVRKSGKLPGELVRVNYSLEYGSDTFEMQKTAIKPNQRVLIIDDLLATGGSIKAACQLVTEVGAKVMGSVVIIELSDLKGRAAISSPVHSLIIY